MYISNEVMPCVVIMIYPKAIDQLTEFPVLGMGKPPSSCWSGKSETPQTLQAFTLVCLSELEGETLLLKTPCMFDTRLGGTELELTWKSLP